MPNRTRLFVLVAAGILVAGLGTGLLASYMGFQNLSLTRPDGPAELSYVSPDARAVAYANVRDVMDSELRRKLMELQPGASKGADSLYEQTGINIQTDVDAVVVTFASGGESQARPLLVVRGNFDTAHIESLIRQRGAVVEEYKGTRLLVHPEHQIGLGFVEAGVVAFGTPDAVRRAVDTKQSGADVRENQDVMRLVRNVDDGNAWAVARFDALTGGQQLPAEVAQQLPAITWFAASGHINGGLRGVVHAETRDEMAANDLREVVRGFVALARMQAGQRAEFASLMNSLELGGQGNTVTLGFAVPSELIDALGALRAAPAVPEAPATPAVPAL